MPDWRSEIREALQAALMSLKLQDSYLFQNQARWGASERTLMFRVAHYLQQEVSARLPATFVVDCEYNLSLDHLKRLNIPANCRKQRRRAGDDLARVSPDIIVHQRGAHDNNLIAIEIKRTQTPTPPDVDELECDRIRLREFVRRPEEGGPLGYSLGCLVLVANDRPANAQDSVRIAYAPMFIEEPVRA